MDNPSGLTSVRALFKVNEVSKLDHGLTKVRMSAIWGKDDERESFAKASPGGTFEVYIDNNYASSKFFDPGDEIYMDFTKKPKPGTV